MEQTNAATQTEDEFQAGLQEAIAQAEEAEAQGDNQGDSEENFFDQQVEVDSETGAAPVEEESFDDWMAKIDAVDLSTAPKGSAIPMQRFRQVLQQRNDTRGELEQLQAEVEQLRQQAQKPAWLDEYSRNIAGKQQTDDEDDAWLRSVLGEDSEHQYGQFDANSLQSMLDNHPTFQRFNNFIAQQEQAAAQMQEAQRLRVHVQEIKEVYPDVPDEFLYQAYAAGQDLMGAAESLMHWRGGSSQATPRSEPAAEAPPVPQRAGSKPVPSKPVDTSKMDDDDFLLHMKEYVNKAFGR